MPPSSTTDLAPLTPRPHQPSPAAAAAAGAPRNAYQSTPASSDRAQRCPNRNGFWPPLYERQWNPHPARSLDKFAQRHFQRCIVDAVANGELHRTVANVLLAFSRASDDQLSDVWVTQAVVAQRLALAESTVCHHVAVAKRLGWIAVQHRNRVDNGFVVGMSNVTRLQLPQHWQDHLDAERRERAARRTRERRHNDHGRAQKKQPTTKTPPQPPWSAKDPVHPSQVDQARSHGAAIARTASTTTFDQGRLELQSRYTRDEAHLFEVAYAEFVEVWQTTRMNT